MKYQLLLLAMPVAAFSFHLNGQNPSRRKSIATSRHRLEYLKPEGCYQLSVEEKEAAVVAAGMERRGRRRNNRSKNNHPINHRHSASDWVYNLRTWKNSSVLREIRNPVMTLTAWATIVSLVQKTLLTVNSKWAANMCISHSAHSFLVSSLGLLLVFRTNSAYQRFLEGRKIWEQILSVSRNFSRLSTLYRNEVGPKRRLRIQYLLASFPYLLRHHVRSGCLCSKEPDHILDQNKLFLQEPMGQSCWVDRQDFPWSLIDNAGSANLNQISKVSNRPLWICDRLGQEIMGIPMNPNFTSRERLKLLGDVDKLANAVGACERIHQTAVPLHYARHALRSLTVWLVTLPFSLVRDFGFMTGPVTAVVAWLLFGVYQIGHSIEDPFQGSLRLSTLCDDIRRNVLGCEEEDVRQSAFYMLEHGENDDSSSVFQVVPEMPVELNEVFPKHNSNIPLIKDSKQVFQDGKFEVVGLK